MGRQARERIGGAVARTRSALGGAAAWLRSLREHGLSPQQRRAALLACALGACGVGMGVFMAWLIAAIAADPSGFSAVVDADLPLACALYALVNTLQVFVGFIPGEPLELVAGYLFGTWGGLAVVRAGLALGELIVFVSVRRWGTRFVRLFVPQEKLDELALFRDARRLNLITFLMMLIPGTPKAIMVYIVGLTPMRLGTWLAISIPARCLSIVASTAVGAQAAQDNWGIAALLFGAACLASLGGVLYYVSISRQAREAAAMERLGRDEWVRAGMRLNDADGQASLLGAPRSDNTAPSYLRELGVPQPAQTR